MTLPTYKPNAICPKCLGDDIYTAYEDDSAYDCYKFPEVYDLHRGEHLHRGCRRCRFVWAEAVASPSMTGAAVPADRTASEEGK